MKKILLFFLIILFPSYVYSLSGDGKTVLTAYCGTISTAQSWTSAYNSGIIYVGQAGNEDLTIGTGGSLTIEAGVTVIFCKTTSDLIITGTGTLTADGTPGSKITFTRDNPTNTYWGHISFQSMGAAGASVFDNCIIEYGDVTSFSVGDPHAGGGALFLDFNNVSVTNCTLQHNKAQWGGGIFVYISRNPSIKNCYFYDNLSKEAGGGLFLYNYSSSVVENSIFYSNTSNGTSSSDYSGGGMALFSSSSTVINCTFANNSSSQTNGQGLELYGSSNAKIINSVFWGSTNQVYLAAGTNGNTIINSAIQAGVPSGSVNCITLNSSNSVSDGPNFTATNGTDWSIKFISPCRDAGTTPSPTVPNDYIGNYRIGPYDIGAYEVQYSRWLTTASTPATWATAGNWEQGLYPGSGTETGDVIIPYLGSDTYAPNISGTTTIASGKYMILEAGAKATFGSLTNSGTLKLKSDATNISSLIVTTFSGNATVELYLTGGGSIGSYKWHYISIPFTTSVPVSTFTGVTFDIAGYNEHRVSSDVSQGWIGYDGWIYASGTPAYDLGYAFSNLTTGRGYEFWDNNTNTFSISGTLNTSDVSPTVTFKSGGIADVNGFNLLGNPFPSGLDWNYIISQSNFPANTSKSLYFTLNNTLASYINGVGVPSGVNGFIPPMQGFMTKTYVSDQTIVLAAAARTHSLHARYKGSSSVIPLIRLSIAEDTFTDETVVRFDELAKPTLDNDFDAVKMSVSPVNLLIYSSLNGTNYVINGQPYPETSIDIPIVINLKKDGTHTISTTELQGLDNYNVYLIDNSTNFSANLKTTPVITFSSSAGLITNRFILKVENVLTGTENPVVSKNIFNIYNGNNLINIQTIADEWEGQTGSVKIFDLTGKTSSDLQNAEFRKNSVIQLSAPAAKGLYMVEIRSGVKRYVGKVVVR